MVSSSQSRWIGEVIRRVDRAARLRVKRLSLTLMVICFTIPACRAKPDKADDARASSTDTGFSGVQARGQAVMGVDQFTSQHVFEDLPDGGQVVLERDDAGDSVGIATIRAHMRDIARRFTSGDFALPGVVHDREVPGTEVMAARREAILYGGGSSQGRGVENRQPRFRGDSGDSPIPCLPAHGPSRGGTHA